MTNIVTNHKNYFNAPAVKAKFHDVLKGKETGFITSLLSILGGNRTLATATPESVMTAAMKAAVLDLPIEPSLGYAYIVPYKRQAQFQLGYKGLIQLAQRSGKYKSINSGIVYKSQLISYNPLFEELEIDFTQPADEVVGYFAAFKLSNGFEKVTYWTKEQAEAHGKRFSQSFNTGPWKTDFDAMAQKTLLKQIISKYGPLSVEIQDAITSDNETESVDIKDVTSEQPETLDDLLGGPELPQEGEEVETEQSTEEEDKAPQTEEEPPKKTRQKKSEVIDQETGEVFEQESLFEGMTTNPKEV